MKERPILFQRPMVQAILEGKKTQTRRVVNPQPFEFGGPLECCVYTQSIVRDGMIEPGLEVFGFADEDNGWVCPYGRPGDRLWCKETHWRFGKWCRNHGRWQFRPDKVIWEVSFDAPEQKPKRTETGWHKRPSIFMPRWASRIDLEVEAVRVERLQDISESDVAAEGLAPDSRGLWAWPGYPSGSNNPIYAYELLWDLINEKKHPWYSNPWVWVPTFRRIRP